MILYGSAAQLYKATKSFRARDYVGKWGNSLSLLLWGYVPVFYTTKFVQTEIYKRGKVSAMCLIEGLSDKTIKHTSLYNIALFLGILRSCGRQEVAGITDDVHL